jgi:hypothetical protein
MGQAVTTITVQRKRSYADSARRYRILVDDQDVKNIGSGKSIEIPVESGDHTIVLKIDWCGSNKLPFSIRQGENLQFECGSSLTGLKIFLGLIYILFKPNEYLWIKKV